MFPGCFRKVAAAAWGSTGDTMLRMCFRTSPILGLPWLSPRHPVWRGESVVVGTVRRTRLQEMAVGTKIPGASHDMVM